MPRYEITGPDNRTAIVEAPEGVSEQEAMAFAQENWASWTDGGRYAMEPATADLRAGTVPAAEQRGLAGEAAAGAARGFTGAAASTGEGAIGLTPLGPIYALAKRMKPELSLSEFVHTLGQEYMPRTREDMVGRAVGTAGEIAGGVLAGGVPTASLPRAAAAIAAPSVAGAVGEQASEAVGLPAWAGTLVGALLGGAAVPRARPLEPAERLFGGEQTAAEAQLARVTADRARQAATPTQAQAVEALSAEMGGRVPTPGQVAGQTGFGEKVARVAFPGVFEKGDEAAQAAAEAIRQRALYPRGQPAAKELGETVVGTARDYVTKVKERTRDVFNEAKAAQVAIDVKPITEDIAAVLAKNEASAGRLLKAGERAELKTLAKQLDDQGSLLSAEGAMDFISGNKSRLRDLISEAAPSEYFSKVLLDLNKKADDAYLRSIATKGDLAPRLRAARDDYRQAMELGFDDAMKQALKKNPEDVGRLFWQRGNVSEIEQLQTVLKQAVKEKAITAGNAEGMNAAMLRGYLQEAAPDIKSLANWKQSVKADPMKSRTFETLLKGPGSAQVRHVFELAQEAATIALRDSAALGAKLDIASIPLNRAAGGGLGVSLVTGTISPAMATLGVGVAGLTRAMATAYTQGNKGVLRSLARVLRTTTNTNPAAVAAVQGTVEELRQWAAENGINDLFVEK